MVTLNLIPNTFVDLFVNLEFCSFSLTSHSFTTNEVVLELLITVHRYKIPMTAVEFSSYLLFLIDLKHSLQVNHVLILRRLHLRLLFEERIRWLLELKLQIHVSGRVEK